jgi:hypothetical protein
VSVAATRLPVQMAKADLAAEGGRRHRTYVAGMRH